jgi:hypothetical protein
MRAERSANPTIIGLIILMLFDEYYEAPHIIYTVRLNFRLSEIGYKYPIPGIFFWGGGRCF